MSPPKSQNSMKCLFYEVSFYEMSLYRTTLADRFNCSVSTIIRKIITWANLYFILGRWNIWLSKEIIQSRLPDSFEPKYSNTKVIIDCTEIKTQVPKSLVLNSQLHSHCKGPIHLKH